MTVNTHVQIEVKQILKVKALSFLHTQQKISQISTLKRGDKEKLLYAQVRCQAPTHHLKHFLQTTAFGDKRSLRRVRGLDIAFTTFCLLI